MNTISTKTASGLPVTVETFDNISDYARAFMARDAWRNANYMTEAPSRHYGADTGEEALTKTLEGDLSCVAPSDALLEQMEALAPATDRPRWIDAIAGGAPNVPAFIAGSPLNMRRRQSYKDEGAPIRVCVDLFASCSFEQKQIRQRGAAVLALVRALSARRPVELYAGCFATSRNSFDEKTSPDFQSPLVRIDTAPLDLARAAYVLTSPTFLRRLAFTGSNALGCDATIIPFRGDARAVMRAVFGDGELFVVPGMVSAKGSDWGNPQKWLIDTLRQLDPAAAYEQEIDAERSAPRRRA